MLKIFFILSVVRMTIDLEPWEKRGTIQEDAKQYRRLSKILSQFIEIFKDIDLNEQLLTKFAQLLANLENFNEDEEIIKKIRQENKIAKEKVNNQARIKEKKSKFFLVLITLGSLVSFLGLIIIICLIIKKLNHSLFKKTTRAKNETQKISIQKIRKGNSESNK